MAKGNNIVFFCNECGYTWKGEAPLLMVEKERLIYEKEERGTEDILQSRLKEREEEMKKKNNMFNTFFRL